ncbi:MAG: aspartate aminotransferase family protein [Phototrophicales bacterium]|nr:MAG: aspartate aminotransferase family protein [Phototrophicales bacterium]RMG70725.1 MAG: aspartate aminotransferase family protein [Chloroflexota bacterium]
MIHVQNVQEIESRYTSGAYSKRPLTIIRGDGCTLWDDEGNAYLDATSGQGVALLGYSHPAVIQAINTQAAQLMTCPEIFYNDQRATLYSTLATILPSEINHFFLCNSGTEAIEGALKVARLLTNRPEIIAIKRGFHGRTMGALSLTWNKKYREPFSGWGIDVEHVTLNDLAAVQAAITDQTAAVVIEVVQGEGGVYPADMTYLQELRALCDASGVLLVVDEIQTGFGRTGAWFAFEHAGILPDIIALGKGIGGGMPMGAVAWRGEPIARGTHGSTFGGNPLACAAAIATIHTLRDENLPSLAKEKGTWLMSELNRRQLPNVREIRGMGLMIGLELRERVTPILQRLQEIGVLALPAGLNVLRLLPPLTISYDELHRLANAIEEATHA